MLAAGARVGEYEIEADLGEGGMARVYRARHSMLDTHHAVKVLDPELRANAEVRQRFLDEARIQAKHLDHPGIVKVTNIVATPEHAALVMELIDGGSLEESVHAFVDRPDEIRRIMLGVLDAVGHAHEAGIVHRDLKPANVLLHRKGGQVVPKVTDFGIAKLGGDGARAKKSTVAGARMGTLGYMSPEQIRRAKDVTARSDIFALGAMLYELATGTLPFEGADDFEVMERIVHARYPAPEAVRPGIDPVIAEVIRRALQPRPEDRYGSCAEMAEALRRLPPEPVKPPPPVDKRPPRPPEGATPARRGRARALALVGGLVVVGGAAAGGVYLWRERPLPEPVRAPVAGDLARYKRALGLEGTLRATIATSRGTLVCDLFEDRAPLAVASFVGLATGLKPWKDAVTGDVRRGVPFYDGRTPVHRAVPGIGIHIGRQSVLVRSSDPGYRFPVEPGGPREAGVLMALPEPDGGLGAGLNLVEIELGEDVGLDDTAFGRCGPLEVLQRLSRVPRDADDRPTPAVMVESIAIDAR